MNLNDSMKYIESEYEIINSTNCNLCNANFTITKLDIEFFNNIAHKIYYCSCEKCDKEKLFIFNAPYVSNINDKILIKSKFNRNLLNTLKF